ISKPGSRKSCPWIGASNHRRGQALPRRLSKNRPEGPAAPGGLHQNEGAARLDRPSKHHLFGARRMQSNLSAFALAGEIQQQLEDVDEVQIEGKRAEDGQLLPRFLVEVFGILLLDVL